MMQHNQSNKHTHVHGGLGLLLLAAMLFPVLPMYAGVGDEVEVISFDGVADDIWSLRVASSHGGGFVVAYHARVRDGSGEWDYLNWGRRFTSYGDPVAPPFQISVAQGDYFDSSVDIDMAPSGHFVIAWSNREEWPRCRVRRYNAFGDPVGDLIFPPDDDYLPPRVGMADSGAFVVAHWDAIPEYLVGHIFDANGDPVLSPFVVNTHGLFHSLHEVAVNPAGTFVVVWVGSTSPGDDNDRESIQARCFTASGTPLGDQFQVNTTIEGMQFYPRAAMADSGAFVIVWESPSSPGSDDSMSSIQMRRFSSACAPLGDQEQVNTYVDSYQDEPDVTVGPNGSFAVVWGSTGSWEDDEDSYSIQARLYTADGQPRGNQFQVNLSTAGVQRYPSISGNPDSKYVVVWVEGEATAKARVLYGPLMIFADSFESGSFSSWSFVQP